MKNRGGIDDRDEVPLVETPEPEYEWLDDPADDDFDLNAYEEKMGLKPPEVFE